MRQSPFRVWRRAVIAIIALSGAAVAAPTSPPKVARFVNDSTIELLTGRQRQTLQRGEQSGVWTLMEFVPGRFAVFENFRDRDGHVVIVDTSGVLADLPKSFESSAADSQAYAGRDPQQILESPVDVLGSEILSRAGDPDYESIARLFPPIQKVRWGTFSFVGTPDTADKTGFSYGGRTANFDPAVYEPSITGIRDAGKVWHGLVGGYLPVMRFVYPQDEDNWTELIAFAPFRSVSNARVQPVWYRVSRIEHGKLKWSRHVDSYHPFPPRADDDPRRFYEDLLHMKARWDELLQPGMQIDLPDDRMENMARFGLVRAMMTRAADFPRYGAVDKDYGGSEHDGFPDTFNVETTAMLDWGLIDRAGHIIDNYFSEFVRDDGSILYRGPETGQFGRMLTVLAQYVSAGGDPALLLKWRRRIEGITNVLLSMRARALELPPNDPAYGMLAGWSEADSSLDRDPARYMQPYFSNSTEAARGFRDLGRVWESIGAKRSDTELTARGASLLRESAALRRDIVTSMSRSLLDVDGRKVLPAIAGVRDPFDVAVRRDSLDPQFRSYRAYMEMMYSGSLTAEQVRGIVAYRASHHDILLGIPTAYGYKTGEIAGFLLYGHAYGLVQSDLIREALLVTYSDMAHQYTRGMWMAPETRRPLLTEETAPYCTPAQLVVSMLARWLLVFEDPESDTLWIGKGMPRTWLKDSLTTSVTGAKTRWGAVDFSITSHANKRRIDARIAFPPTGLRAETRLRLRAFDSARLKSVTLNGKRWTQFDPGDEVITLPASTAGTISIVAKY